jgi:putative transposase
MGIEALYRRPRTTKPEPGHKIYPYLLRGMEITRPNQVWAMDITYIPMARGFVYLAAVLDWATRRVLSWRLSITMEAAFCVETLEDALARHGKPDIFNTDQGSQFTGAAFTGVLADNGIAISMDGKGAWRDNVFVERLWRTVKYEEVYLRAYETVGEARYSIGRYLDFYNGNVHTRALTTGPRIKPTLIFLRSARRPNPGRGSTYRRGLFVQTTGTSSVFVAQSANRKLSFDKVKTLVVRDAGLLASPLPLSTFKPPSQAASNTGTGASTGNVSSVTQYGTNNLAVVAQASAANRSAVMQHGSGNTALVTQRSGH